MASDEVPWKLLHPGSVVVNLLPRLYRLVRSLWPFALAWIYGQSQDGAGIQIFDATILLVFFGLAGWSTVLHWLTLRYRVSEGRLEVRSGLLNRQVRVIPPERIQNIEMVRNIFHRAVGLVEVKIETASGSDVEGELSALDVDAATALISALGKARAEETVAELPVVVQNTVPELMRFGATAGRLGAIAVLVGLAAEWLQWTDPDQIEEVGGMLGAMGAFALLVAALSGAFVLGISSSLLRHYGFKLMRRDNALVATEGLFTTRQVELPLAKVQLVTVTEPVIRRLLGFGSVHIETAAAREGEGGVHNAEAVAPYVEAAGFAKVVHAALPGLDVDIATLRSRLKPPHKRALIRAIAVGTTRNTLIAAVMWWFIGGWAAAVFLLIPLGWATAYLDHRFQGWLVTDRLVVARRGWWNRVTQIVERDKLQALAVSQGPFLRNYGLAVLTLRVAGSAVQMPVLSWENALAVQQDLLRTAPKKAA